MNYKSIVFREFTHESLERIKHYQREESERIASQQLERKMTCDDTSDQHRCWKRTSKDEPMAPKRVPNKQLAVGQRLPRVLRHKFPAELIGRPIEEIDDYYRTDDVCIIF